MLDLTCKYIVQLYKGHTDNLWFGNKPKFVQNVISACDVGVNASPLGPKKKCTYILR